MFTKQIVIIQVIITFIAQQAAGLDNDDRFCVDESGFPIECLSDLSELFFAGTHNSIMNSEESVSISYGAIMDYRQNLNKAM